MSPYSELTSFMSEVANAMFAANYWTYQLRCNLWDFSFRGYISGRWWVTDKSW